MQGGRGGGVDGHAGSAQVEHVGDAVGYDCGGGAGGVVRGQVADLAFVQVLVVQVEGAQEDANAGAGQRAGGDGGVLDAGPGEFEHDALLRVHALRLERGQPEEGGVEGVDAGEESAPPADERAVTAVGRVPPIGRDGADGAAGVAQVVPELPIVVRTGKATCHANDSDIVLAHKRQPSGYISIGVVRAQRTTDKRHHYRSGHDVFNRALRGPHRPDRSRWTYQFCRFRSKRILLGLKQRVTATSQRAGFASMIDNVHNHRSWVPLPRPFSAPLPERARDQRRPTGFDSMHRCERRRQGIPGPDRIRRQSFCHP